MIRFTHPVLAEYCMASYLASQTADELRGIVTAHRWFDTPWYEIWPLTAGLMAHPGTLVELLLDTPTDSWYEQTFLASRCVAVAGARMSTELKTRVLSAVISATQSWRSFDRERALLHLGELVHARLDEAVKASRRLLNSEEIESSTLLRVAGLLAEIGDPAGLKIARKCVSDRGVPTVYRAWNARAIVLANDPEGLVALQSAIRNARTVSELRILVNAIPVESQVGSNLAAQILRDHEVHTRIRATVGAALIRTGDAHRIRLAKELAATPLTVWHLRAALISELLAVGEDDVLQLGLELFDDPNLSADQRVTLVESLVRRGETAVLPRAVQMLSRRDISWEERRQLARSVVELGPAGIEELLTQVRSPLDIDLKMRHIIALVEAGECLDLAAELVADPGAPAWIRTRVATSLLERGYLSIPHTVVAELATDFEPEHDFQGELIIAMAGRDIPGAGAAAVSLLGRERASKANYAGSKKFIGGLATAGPEGYASLDRIARDNELAEEDRALAIDAMADTNPGEAAQLALSLAEQFTKFANSRLTLLLADKGVVEVADQLSTQLRDEPAAYRALFQLLSSPRASQELVEALLPAAHAATIAEAPEPPAPLTLDSHFLEEAGITWSSEAEKEAITDWVADRIREKVSTKVFSFLTTSQLDEYEQLESAEQHVEFLATRSGGYPELVRSQAAVVQQEIRDNPSIVPPFNVVQTMQPMRRLSYIAAAIEEWVILTQSSGPQSSAQFLAANESVIVTPEGHALLRIACQMTAAWNPYEGHQFLVEVALRNGLQASRKLMEDSDKLHDLLREYLNEGNGMQLLYAALAGLVLEPGSEVVAFYGALGAALLENMELSVALMALSGRSASEDQRKDGLATLQENAERFQWNEECVRVLRGALRNELGDIE
ncbi:hypothetical protein B0I32_115314 [Nonomuraea fuscirosea]|uniref:HEAT repeat protein n=2 Tax=Nonomuraea fuscirosea TaxID=1291556 RepID=A0A2T0MSK3_9ACTN|nr:hypothetical protein B0I32_115314 [Nonomuraea fuscirosea]